MQDLIPGWDGYGAKDLATLYDVLDDLAEEQRMQEPAPPPGQVRFNP